MLGERLRIICTEFLVSGVLKVVVEQAYLREEGPECHVVWKLGIANFVNEVLQPSPRCILY